MHHYAGQRLAYSCAPTFTGKANRANPTRETLQQDIMVHSI